MVGRVRVFRLGTYNIVVPTLTQSEALSILQHFFWKNVIICVKDASVQSGSEVFGPLSVAKPKSYLGHKEIYLVFLSGYMGGRQLWHMDGFESAGVVWNDHSYQNSFCREININHNAGESGIMENAGE